MAGSLLRVALTGGIATGKSFCLQRLGALGAATIDADVLARHAVRPGSAGLAAVVARFGPDILQPNGQLDRAALGQIVFRDPGARRALEAIVHPIVYAELDAWFGSLHPAANGPVTIAIADIPLLFETGMAGAFDVVVVAACSAEQQLTRLMARDGLSEEEANRRIGTQWPIDRKRAAADLVIDTSGTVDETDRGVREAWHALERRAARA